MSSPRLEPDDFILPMHRNLGRLHRARPRPAAAVPPAPRPRGRLHQGPRPHLPLRAPREGHRRHDQPPRGDAAGGRRAGPRRPAARATGRVAAASPATGRRARATSTRPLNLAAVWKLPVALRDREQPVRPLDPGPRAVRLPATWRTAASATACRGVVVDGNDLLAVHRGGARGGRARAARRGPDAPRVQDLPHARPRGGLGHRLRAEGSSSRSGRRRTRSCASRRFLVEHGRPRAEPTRDAIRAAYKARIDALVDEALGRAGAALAPSRRSWPTSSPPACSSPAALPGAEAAAPELRYVDAISDGLREAMRRDERVVLLGPGHRRVRRRLQGHRGLRRGVRQGPGAQHADHRVGRHRRGPRAWPSAASCRWSRCSSATSSPAASTRSSTTWPRPTTAGARASRWCIRVPVGGGAGAGPFHSQNVESWFTSVAGLKVLAPATPYDAKGLLLAAFEDGNPVLYLEHKLLYRSAKGPVPDGLLHAADRPGARRPRGPRRHRRDLRRRRALGARSRRGARRRGPRDRGDRPALARALGRRDRASPRSRRRAAASCSTRRR